MKTLLTIFLLGSAFAQAQITVTTGSPGANGTDIYIHNDTAAHLTAFVATWIMPHPTSGHASSYIFRDALIEDNIVPLNPGEQQTITVGGNGAVAEQPQLQAALFDDGSTFGDPTWVSMLIARRADYLRALNMGLADLHNASIAQGATFNSLIQQLKVSLNAQITDLKSKGQASPYLSQLFTETTPAMKEANLLVVAQNMSQSCIGAVYNPLIHGFTKASSNPAISQASFVKMVTDLSNILTQKQRSLLASKPPVGS